MLWSLMKARCTISANEAVDCWYSFPLDSASEALAKALAKAPAKAPTSFATAFTSTIRTDKPRLRLLLERCM